VRKPIYAPWGETTLRSLRPLKSTGRRSWNFLSARLFVDEFDRFFQGSRGALAGPEAAANPMMPAGGITGAGGAFSGGDTTHFCCRRQPAGYGSLWLSCWHRRGASLPSGRPEADPPLGAGVDDRIRRVAEHRDTEMRIAGCRRSGLLVLTAPGVCLAAGAHPAANAFSARSTIT
jgi:hypothetical protein